MKLNQRGDTLIEVAIAIVIVGTILFSAYVLSSKAFQLGQSAKERSQAVQLAQQQAEGLRSLRDNQSWASLASEIRSKPQDASGYFHFHIEKSNSGGSDKWSIVASSSDGTAEYKPLGSDSFYRTEIAAKLLPNSVASDKLEARVFVQWERFGTGTPETTELFMKLTDRNFQLSLSELVAGLL